MAMARESQPVFSTNSSYLLGTGVGGIRSGNLDLVLNAGQGAQLSLDHNAVVMGILHHLTGDARCSPQRAWRKRRS